MIAQRVGCRKSLVYGFTNQKDDTGETVGWSVLKLPRRGAFEAIGLRRPTFRPLPRVRPVG